MKHLWALKTAVKTAEKVNFPAATIDPQRSTFPSVVGVSVNGTRVFLGNVEWGRLFACSGVSFLVLLDFAILFEFCSLCSMLLSIYILR